MGEKLLVNHAKKLYGVHDIKTIALNSLGKNIIEQCRRKKCNNLSKSNYLKTATLRSATESAQKNLLIP
ncbi:hypothetical protein KIN20_003533 [Parelaphostrongylus tenuis]|uniref:Uncharacterized protein n=1 Tax=Parelaphostrongylus tenuis TaxID=148309 RepID=A0AAD5LWW9_PARTN|nr:hypothetical protein KIN20_003533 [Parelaphostrongylus tenuis]